MVNWWLSDLSDKSIFLTKKHLYQNQYRYTVLVSKVQGFQPKPKIYSSCISSRLCKFGRSPGYIGATSPICSRVPISRNESSIPARLPHNSPAYVRWMRSCTCISCSLPCWPIFALPIQKVSVANKRRGRMPARNAYGRSKWNEINSKDQNVGGKFDCSRS